MSKVTIIGAGLAGSEAAWQLLQRGIAVRLIEMRPAQTTPAHRTGCFAELVCSNSLRSAALENAVGLLKEELRRCNSLIISSADQTAVPAGGALAVDREAFSRRVTNTLMQHPLLELVQTEATNIPDAPAIIATGPLTSPTLAAALQDLLGTEYLYFYDAAAPIVTGASLDFEQLFLASRYDKGEASYWNAPFTKEAYQHFWEELTTAQVAPAHLPEERARFFEGCLPVEVLAARGPDALRYGPLKPVGLIDPQSGRRPYAVVQLRSEDREGRLYNLVGFQTNLRQTEQERIVRLIPGLQQAELVRYGVMHRNTYLNSPLLLDQTLALRGRPGLFVAGQLTGVEGYVESTAAGLVAGINCARWVSGQPLLELPPQTALGALMAHLNATDARYFQPMNINFGLFPPLEQEPRDKRLRHQALAQRSLELLCKLIESD